ncbi:unnamed protein product [Parnassius apollo]|uniref:(apollo) hypothetical protein n=1 Tax=Parnassius apollo TaxID=110799 RepID=A0A8S3WK97_PARAO|nr:unnamed protein product [Parnassius apollo]
MDLTAILGSNNKFTEITPSNPNNLLCEELVRKNMGVKTDALSAVKLDPAVLEAQITIEATNNMTYCEPDEAINEEVVKRETPAAERLDFEETLNSMHRNALLNLTSQQFALLMIYVSNLRKQRVSFQKRTECAFCKNSGESAAWYTSHALRDRKGRVRCPMLRALTCPLCGDTGDRAHTLKYCPNNSNWRI